MSHFNIKNPYLEENYSYYTYQYQEDLEDDREESKEYSSGEE